MTDHRNKATTLRELRQVCRPGPLARNQLDAFFVETAPARNPHQRTRELIANTLADVQDARILFYGHRDCGKSTELNKLLAELGGRFLAVQFSVEENMNMAAACAEDLLLLICERILQRAQEAKLDVDEAVLGEVSDYFTETVKTTGTERGTGASLAAGAKAESPSLLSSLLGLFGQFRGEIRYNAHSDTTTVARLRKRPADLVAQTNAVIQAIRERLPAGQQLLVIVEDLDKLDLARARPMFVENAALLASVTTNIIYTVPVFLFHSPDVGQFRPHFDEVYGLPMIKVREPGGDTPAQGAEVIKRIVRQRVDASLIEDDALDLLVEKTGGVLRLRFPGARRRGHHIGRRATPWAQPYRVRHPAARQGVLEPDQPPPRRQPDSRLSDQRRRPLRPSGGVRPQAERRASLPVPGGRHEPDSAALLRPRRVQRKGLAGRPPRRPGEPPAARSACMSETAQHLERLRNAIRQPVAAITAVEVDTVARAQGLVAELGPHEPDRPVAVLAFDARQISPEALLDKARAATKDWPSERGVLFLVDRTGAGEGEPTAFWQGMNFLREAWGGLAVHAVFLLLPLDYRLLMTVADHLADWIPLRFHFREAEDAEPRPRRMADYRGNGSGLRLPSPRVARQRLAQLEPALKAALLRGDPPALLMRRYYLPMFQASVSLADMHRASSLYRQIDEQAIPEPDRPGWWHAAAIYHLDRLDLAAADGVAARLLRHAEETGDAATKGLASHLLGRVAEERREFAVAENWYRRSLEVEEELGYEHGMAETYGQLGNLFLTLRRFGDARDSCSRRPSRSPTGWRTLRSLPWSTTNWGWSPRGNATSPPPRSGTASPWRSRRDWLGIVAQQRGDFTAAEEWYRKSLEIEERLGNNPGAASTRYQLGVLAGAQGRYEAAARLLAQASATSTACHDPQGAAMGARAFALFYHKADSATQARLAAVWREAGLGPLPEPDRTEPRQNGQ